MTTPSSRPDASSSLNMHGAVDLSGLKNRSSSAAGTGGQPAGASGAAGGAGAQGQQGSTSGHRFILNVTEETFGQVVQLSSQVPVVVELGSARTDPSGQLSALLEKLAVEYNGRILLARVDADASPQIVQAFQVQSVPSVVAVLKGQPVPLFEGAQPEEHIRSFLQELLKVAEANGVTGSLEDEGGEAASAEEQAPLPPLHQEAFDAIEAGDYDAAAAAYRKALAEKPADAEAKAGLAQVELMQRVQDMDGDKVRRDAADAPDSVPAQLAVADLDVVGGHVEDAFSRLVKLVGRTGGDDRETARARLVELFDVVGVSDPRVSKARSALARALF